jgi:3-methylfumaryl-CoA hydratase
MWAGSSLAFHSQIREGDSIDRRSTIRAIEEKQGRTGPLCFVTVRHEISTLRGIAIEESQSIVYRSPESAASDSKSKEEPTAPKSAPIADQVREVSVDPVVLFRYSAVTFNGHRIHYDAPYAIETEHYSGLVVHGPLQATYLLNFAATLAGRTPARFNFRALAPASGVKTIFLNVRNSSEHAMELWVADPQGRITMSGEAAW